MIFFGHVGITTAAIKSIEKQFKSEEKIDYRFVILGSILPDLIDKSAGLIMYGSLLKGERYFAHTLLFSILVIIIGIVNSKINNSSNILTLGICSLFHTVLDFMWIFPDKYFYPLYGFTFPMNNNFIMNPLLARMIFFNIYSYAIFEIIGLALCYKYIYKSVADKGIISFLKNGNL